MAGIFGVHRHVLVTFPGRGRYVFGNPLWTEELAGSCAFGSLLSAQQSMKTAHHCRHPGIEDIGCLRTVLAFVANLFVLEPGVVRGRHQDGAGYPHAQALHSAVTYAWVYWPLLWGRPLWSSW